MDASQFSLMGMWEQMGWIAKGVVIILAAMSIYSLGFAIERLWKFHKAKQESLKVALGVTPLLKQHKLDEAIARPRTRNSAQPSGRVLAAGLTEFQYESSQDPLRLRYRRRRQACNRARDLMTTAEMKKGLGNLATISTTAPFIGLFGTVVGIINSFRVWRIRLGRSRRGQCRNCGALFATASAFSWRFPLSGSTTTFRTRSSASTWRCPTLVGTGRLLPEE